MKDRLSRYYCQALEIISPRKISQLENRSITATFFRILQLVAISPEEGAQTIIYLASSPAVKGVTGEYFVKQQAVRSSQVSYDRIAAERLWQVSAELTRL
jgi:adenylosuccinate lyase